MANLEKAIEIHRQGRAADAERMCREILAARPKDARTTVFLCDLLLQRDRVEEAEQFAAAALTEHPDHAELLMARGIALARLGRRHEGLDHLDRAVERRLFLPPAQASLNVLLAD